jgi:hypothetical protein
MIFGAGYIGRFYSGTGELSDSRSMERDLLEKLVVVQEITATGPTLTHINPSARPGWPAVGVKNILRRLFF